MKPFFRFCRPIPPAGDELAYLLLAAQEDAAFRAYLVGFLSLPAAQRETLIHTAIHEMTLRGESAELRAAFAALIRQPAADEALRILGETVAPPD